jgi:hypothetical protein
MTCKKNLTKKNLAGDPKGTLKVKRGRLGDAWGTFRFFHFPLYFLTLFYLGDRGDEINSR